MDLPSSQQQARARRSRQRSAEDERQHETFRYGTRMMAPTEPHAHPPRRPDEANRARQQETARSEGGPLGEQVMDEAAAQRQIASGPDTDDDAWVGVHEQPTLRGIDLDGSRVEHQAPLALVVDDIASTVISARYALPSWGAAS